MTAVLGAQEVVFKSELRADVISIDASDAMVCSAARVSTKGEATRDDDVATAGLINFLMKNRHGTPFEHNNFIFFVSAPIFVFREFHRHRIGWSYNEESGRYKQLAPVFYIPPDDRKLVQVGKPGHYTYVAGTSEQTQMVREEIGVANLAAYDAYQRMLDAGIAKEVARMCLPVNIYTSMYATCNARSLMAFLSLRQARTQREPFVSVSDEGYTVEWDGEAMFASSPMKEINVVADLMEDAFAEAMPLTYNSFVDNGYVAP